MAAPLDYAPVKNVSGVTIPSGGLLRVTGIDPDTGAFTVDKPDTNGDPAVAVNSEILIPAGGAGVAHWGSRAVAAYAAADGTPAPGDQWGAMAGSWLLHRGRAGFEILAGPGQGLVNVVRTYQPEAGGSGSGAGAGGGGEVAPRCSGVVSSETVYRYTNVANQLVQLSRLRTLAYNSAGCLVVTLGPESSSVLGCIPCPDSGGSGSGNTTGSGGSAGGTCCTLPDTLTVALTSACSVFSGASQTVTRTIGQNWNWSRAEANGTYHQLGIGCVDGLYTVTGTGRCSDGVTPMGFTVTGTAADCAAFSVTGTGAISGGGGAPCCEGGTVTATAAL